MQALSVFEQRGPGAQGGGLDARARMAVSVLATVAVVVISNMQGMLLLVGVSFIYALGLRRPRALLLAYALVALMCGMALGCTWLMGQAVPRLMRDLNAASLTIPFLRIVVMLHVVLPLALSSRVQELITSLRGLRLPFCVYLPTVVVLRFLPTFWNDTRQIIEAVKMRGFSVNPVSLTLHPLLSLRLLFTPLLFRCLRSSEDLGIAAELKGLGHSTRMTPYRTGHWSRADSLLVAMALLTCLLALACQWHFGKSVIGGH